MAYKQQPKSPMLKALKGNQGKLPQHLQDAIKAAPESPAKQTKKQEHIIAENKKADKKLAKESDVKDSYKAREAVKSGSYANYDDAKKDAAKSRMARYGFPESVKSASPAKQTTAGEFAHKKSIKDKEMGKSTKVVDKFTSALEAPFSDKTYSELKKEKRAKQKAKYNAKSPAKQTKKKYKIDISKKERVPPAPKTPVGPKAEKPKTKKEVLIKNVNKKRYR